MDILGLAVWGVGGAFCYAAPRLLVELTEARVTKKPWLPPTLEFAVAMGVGALFGCALDPFVSEVTHLSKGAEQRALAFLTGLIANRISPSVVSLLSDQVLRKLGAPLETKK